MKKFVKPEFKVLKLKNNTYGKFAIEPLERGYSITLGNAIRRTLISSTYGPSIFGVKIQGATHEFDTLPGVKENIAKIILNLKSVVLKVNEDLFSQDDIIELSLSAEGKKNVLKLSDIILPSGVQILNKNFELVHFEDNAKVEMIFYAKISCGYKTFQDNKEDCKEISSDIISIDSNFSPIEKVNFTFEDIKIGKNSDLERLILEIETNASISPFDAVSIASSILIKYFSLFTQSDFLMNNKQEIFISNEKDIKEDKDIDELGLSPRSINCLKNFEINTLNQLLNFSENEIKQIKNLGKKSFKEIKDKLKEWNLKFK